MTTQEQSELEALERAAKTHLADMEGAVEAGLEEAAAAVEDEAQPAIPVSTSRVALAVSTSILGAAVMAGGMFNGLSPRFYAAVAGLLGVGLAVACARIRRVPVMSLVMVVGLLAIGILAVVPDGIDTLVRLGTLVNKAAASSKNLRPPIDMTPGWTAVLAWIMATVGFAAAWTGLTVRKPSIALLLPLPLAGVAAISVPKDEQLVSGLAVFVLFAAGLGIVSGIGLGGGEDRLPIGFEIRRSLKALPIMIAVTGGMFFLASQSSFLFPRPLVDPAQTPQKPKTVPLSQVPDRVLFDVQSSVTGPWVLGTLDVYQADDGTWRLPPFAQNQLKAVARDGVVDRSQNPGLKATITIRGLEGAVLPGLPNTVLVVASGPPLAFDSRSGNIRMAEGQLEPGFSYKVAAAALPSITDLRKAGRVRPELARFTDIPAPPPAVRALIAKAPKTSKWDEFDYLRTYVLQNVTAAGQGTPVAVPVSRVQDILGSQQMEASPFEIVALQVMLARWAGVPARIAYGFDGGDRVGDVLEVHPTNGAAFPEVYFSGYEWLPVVGTPARAKVNQSSDPRFQQKRTDILPSSDIAVPIFLPTVEAPESLLYQQIRDDVLTALPFILALALLYVLWPVGHKAIRRARRRSAAAAAGPRARIIQAYAEWRDHATDFGYRSQSDTPLMYLERFVRDEEHAELAWLVTRTLWGDLQGDFDDEMATDAEEYGRVLKGRLSAAQPISVRVAAALSRLSLRQPFDERALRAIREEEVDRVAVAA